MKLTCKELKMMNKQENAIDRPLFQGLAARIPNSQVRPSNGRIIAKLFKAYLQYTYTVRTTVISMHLETCGV